MYLVLPSAQHSVVACEHTTLAAGRTTLCYIGVAGANGMLTTAKSDSGFVVGTTADLGSASVITPIGSYSSILTFTYTAPDRSSTELRTSTITVEYSGAPLVGSPITMYIVSGLYYRS